MLHIVQKQSGENIEEGAVEIEAQTKEVAFSEQSMLSVVHLPKLSTSLVSSKHNLLIVKVQNIAYSTQILTKIDFHVVAHSSDDSSVLCDTQSDHAKSSADPSIVSSNGLTLTSVSNLPLRLVSMETHTMATHVDVKNGNFISDASQMYDIHADITWLFEDCPEVTADTNIIWPITSRIRLANLEVRHAGLIITAVPDCRQPILPNTQFSMQYTIQNKLQDVHNLRLVWSPERALQEKKAHDDTEYRQSVQHVSDCVICHQPVLELGTCVQGSSTRVLIDFTVLTPGIYELGQHMKLNIQPSVRGSPNKGAMCASSPPSSPYHSPCHVLANQQQLLCTHSNKSPTHKVRTKRPLTAPCKSDLQKPVGLQLRSDASHSQSIIISHAPSPGIQSPPTPVGAQIHRSQVLKRNCQVLVLDPATIT